MLAQRTADATIKEAKDEAARLLSEAREERRRSGRDRGRGPPGHRGRPPAAEAEVEQLLEARDALQADIEALDDVMRQQRDRIAAASASSTAARRPHAAAGVGAHPARRRARGATETGRHARVELPEPSDPVDAGYGHEPAVPFPPGNQVGVAPRRAASRPRELAPTPGSPFAYNGNGNGTPEPPSPAPWPSQLRTAVDDEQSPPADGYDANARPSEWGRPVCDRRRRRPADAFGR